jgi:hypothetical protein
MSRNKFYLQNKFFDENSTNFFSIASSKEGIVIPLNYFNYDNTHLTIYKKKMKNKEGYEKISIHLTKNNKIIYENIFEINEEELNKNILNKLLIFLIKYKKLVDKYKINEDYLLKNDIYCFKCFIELEGINFNKDFRTKKLAKESYNKLLNLSKNKKKYPHFTKCNKPKHSLLSQKIDNNYKLFQKTPFGVIDLSNDIFYKKIDFLFEKIFHEETSKAKELMEIFKQKLEECKLK